MGLIEAVMAVVVSLTGSHWVSSDNSKQSVEFKTSQIMATRVVIVFLEPTAKMMEKFRSTHWPPPAWHAPMM